MRSFDLIIMCFKNLLGRKVRTLLTVFGVVVGTCALVVMISLGLGMEKSLDAQLASMGDLTMIEIYNWNTEVTLDDDAMEEILEIPGVLTATPFFNPQNLNARLFVGKNDRYSSYPRITGVYPEALGPLGFQTVDGSDPSSLFEEPMSILIGEKYEYQFSDSRKTRGDNRVNPYPGPSGEIPEPYFDALEEQIIIRFEKEDEKDKDLEYEPITVGRMIEDYSKGGDTGRGAYMAIEDLKEMEAAYMKANRIKTNDDEGYQEAKVKVHDIKDVEVVEAALKEMGFTETYSADQYRKPMEEGLAKQQAFLGIIAGVSLFVAALGIANTMLMSIFERTREIGIMKVVGCYVKDIRVMFLMEAGCIGFMGGAVGVISALIISSLMNMFGFSTGMEMGMGSMGAEVSIIPAWLIVAALVFSTLIGVISGYYPANRAVKISALTAIKQD